MENVGVHSKYINLPIPLVIIGTAHEEDRITHRPTLNDTARADNTYQISMCEVSYMS